MANASRSSPRQVAAALEVLREAELLSGMTDAELERLAPACEILDARSGQLLFVAGDRSDRLFLVLTGRVRIFTASPDGEELVLAHLGPGDSIGELSVIDGAERSAAAQVIERSRLLAIPADVLRSAFLRSPLTLLSLTERLAATVRRLTGSTSDMVFLDLQHRVAKLVLELCEQEGRAADDGVLVAQLPTSQSGIAAQLGATRQSVNLALRTLVRAGLVEVDGRAVRVPDLDALRDYVTA